MASVSEDTEMIEEAQAFCESWLAQQVAKGNITKEEAERRLRSAVAVWAKAKINLIKGREAYPDPSR